MTALSDEVKCYWLGRKEYELCIAHKEEHEDEAHADDEHGASANREPRFVVSSPRFSSRVLFCFRKKRSPGCQVSDRSQLKIACLLGKGGFGRVLLAEHRPSKKLMALKAMSKKAVTRAAKGCENPNFKGSYFGRFPLVSADFWTSDHLSERSRSMYIVPRTRARGTAKLKRR